MKKIEAIIRPEKLEQVKEVLAESGFYAMTISEVRGRGAQKGIALQFRGKKIEVDLIPKVKIEMVVMDNDIQEVIGIIRASARTGKNGDGKVFIYPVEMMANVRTDEESQERPEGMSCTHGRVMRCNDDEGECGN